MGFSKDQASKGGQHKRTAADRRAIKTEGKEGKEERDASGVRVSGMHSRKQK